MVQKVRQTILLPERKRFKMPKPRTQSGEKNLISQRLIELRRTHNMSQRDLAYKLQLAGYDMDKNVITRIETQQRYVTDIEIKALCDLFNVTFEDLIK
jgi:DNA-binding XRE family transcriptional regulator